VALLPAWSAALNRHTAQQPARQSLLYSHHKPFYSHGVATGFDCESSCRGLLLQCRARSDANDVLAPSLEFPDFFDLALFYHHHHHRHHEFYCTK